MTSARVAVGNAQLHGTPSTSLAGVKSEDDERDEEFSPPLDIAAGEHYIPRRRWMTAQRSSCTELQRGNAPFEWFPHVRLTLLAACWDAALLEICIRQNTSVPLREMAWPLLAGLLLFICFWAFWLLCTPSRVKENTTPFRFTTAIRAVPSSATRTVEVRGTPPPQLSPVVTERIKQLEERTRICTRSEWEEKHIPQLLKRANGASPPRQCSCCICLSDIAPDSKVRGLACGHIFHLQCVAQWFMRDETFQLCCPLCRLPLASQSCIPSLDISGKSGIKAGL